MHFLRAHIHKVAVVAFVAAAISASVSMAILYSSLSSRKNTPRSSVLMDKLKSHVQVEPEKTDFNILLLGYGGAGHSGGGLSDAIVLANVNTEKKIVNLIAIPRDTWVELPIRSDLSEHYKINTAYAIGNDDNRYPLKEPLYVGGHGGGEMAKYAAKTVTGIPVDYYASVDFARFENAIDVLEGISVEVPVSFTDEYYPIKGEENNLCDYTLPEVDQLKAQYSGFELEKQFKCRYETLSFTAGKAEMDGATALKFVRSRHSNEHGGDFARGVRQQAVLTAVRNKLLSLDALSRLDEFYEEFSQMIKTDMSEEGLIEILSHVGNPQEYTSKNININADNYMAGSVSSDGQSIVIPKTGIDNFEEIHEFIQSEIN
jgi:anionic cell wall polymer biosynthesis LytR-Cps2A-Psr (LCP) family protein